MLRPLEITTPRQLKRGKFSGQLQVKANSKFKAPRRQEVRTPRVQDTKRPGHQEARTPRHHNGTSSASGSTFELGRFKVLLYASISIRSTPTRTRQNANTPIREHANTQTQTEYKDNGKQQQRPARRSSGDQSSHSTFSHTNLLASHSTPLLSIRQPPK